VKCESLLGQKTAMLAAALLAVTLALLLLGISYVLFPAQSSQEPPLGTPIPKPEPLICQVFWAVQWIGLAVFIALCAVGVMLLVLRTKRKKTSSNEQERQLGRK
jgi:ABC-type Fe3+ transport system permease subunit